MAGSEFSKTLNEIDINATLSAPFASASLLSTGVNSVLANAMFYSPPDTLGSDRSDPSGGSWKDISWDLASSGPMDFSRML